MGHTDWSVESGKHVSPLLHKSPTPRDPLPFCSKLSGAGGVGNGYSRPSGGHGGTLAVGQVRVGQEPVHCIRASERLRVP